MSNLSGQPNASPRPAPIPHDNQQLDSAAEKLLGHESAGTKPEDTCKDAEHACKTVQHQSQKLYIIRAGKSTLFKIGISADPQKRLRGMQSGSAQKLYLVRSMAYASSEFEHRAHALLKDWRAHGEWFDLGPRAEAFAHKVSLCRATTLLAALGDVSSLQEADPALGPYNEWDDDAVNREPLTVARVRLLLDCGFSQQTIDRYAQPQPLRPWHVTKTLEKAWSSAEVRA